MARPERHDVDYFPFYVKDGRTLFILESKYGCKGTGFFTNVMRFLCQQSDHYFQIITPSDEDYFFAKTHCDKESGLDMLNTMVNTGKLSEEMWVSYKVIISEDLLQSITDAYRNRKNPILNLSEIREKIVSYKQNPVSYVINPQASVVSDVGNTQTKLKETKLIKETKKRDLLFEKFYQAYPKKRSKGKALNAWGKISPPPDEQLVAQMVATIERVKTLDEWKKDSGKFIPHPATWLNAQGWLDEIEKPQPPPHDGGRVIKKSYDCHGCNKNFTDYEMYLKHNCQVEELRE